MEHATTASPEFLRKVLVRFALVPLAFPLMFFVPAGRWDWWQAWVFIGIVVVPMIFAVRFLIRSAPDLLERRMHLREKEVSQRRIVPFATVSLLGAMWTPALAVRFGWPMLPTGVVLVADLFVLAGYLLVLRVFAENRYAGRIVEVEAGQTVVSTGPYAIVRHPMYLGSIVMYAATPLALGSAWGLVFVVPVVWSLVARIRKEEELLLRDLNGYAAYCQQVRFRLIPGIW